MYRNQEVQTVIPSSPPLGVIISTVLQSCFITSLRAPSLAFFPLWLEYLKANCRHHTMRAIKKKKQKKPPHFYFWDNSRVAGNC